MKHILLSIITATYNAEHTIQRTLKSVESQTYGWAIEHIIVDGASKDATMGLVNEYREQQHPYEVIAQSEPDNGLYDALNKGLRMASGLYVCFLNAGDTFHSPYTLESIFENTDTDKTGILYGETDIVDDEGHFLHKRRLSAPENLKWTSFKNGMLVCHQSFIPKKELCPEYDTRYRFSADFDWCIKVMKKCESEGLQKCFCPDVIADYLDEGLTTKNRNASLKERFRIMVVHYGWLSTVLHHIWFVFRLIVKH